jgi:hypothetical protein
MDLVETDGKKRCFVLSLHDPWCQGIQLRSKPRVGCNGLSPYISTSPSATFD